jgi:hypothetical protein
MPDIEIKKWELPNEPGVAEVQLIFSTVTQAITLSLSQSGEPLDAASSGMHLEGFSHAIPMQSGRVDYDINWVRPVWVDPGDGWGGIAPEMFDAAMGEVRAVLSAFGIRDSQDPIAINICFETETR